jgi:hypothetical protein
LFHVVESRVVEIAPPWEFQIIATCNWKHELLAAIRLFQDKVNSFTANRKDLVISKEDQE